MALAEQIAGTEVIRLPNGDFWRLPSSSRAERIDVAIREETERLDTIVITKAECPWCGQIAADVAALREHISKLHTAVRSNVVGVAADGVSPLQASEPKRVVFEFADEESEE